MPIFAQWQKRVNLKVMHAMVVKCQDCGREDTINSEDTRWTCPDCKREWLINELRRLMR